MGSPPILHLILFHIVSLVVAATAPPSFVSHNCVDTYGNYTSNSTYGDNLNTVLSDITSDTRIHYGFYNFSSPGQGSDEVHGIGLCRGDVTLTTCHNCFNDSSYKLRELCPNQREAIVWYNECMLRYSNRSIFRIREDQPSFLLQNGPNASNVDRLSKTLGPLLGELQNSASAVDSEHKYAAKSAKYTDSDQVYALAQCTPDLSQSDCYSCLDDSIGAIFTGSQGAQYLKPSCNLRYELYQFYTIPLNTSAPTSPPNTTYNPINTVKGSNTGKVPTIITVATVIFVAIIVLVSCCLWWWRKKVLKIDQIRDEIRRDDFREYNFGTIRAATENFSEEKKLGHGGFGDVYQGTLFDGQEIAVNRLGRNSGQGEVEFRNEVLLLAKLHHRNLIRLIGFCLEEEERLLIYEFVPNRSLDYFLFDSERHVHLNWETRYKIIQGVARGMVYLHEDSRLRIIHRDMKASSILLDSEMNAKIANFGMVRLVQMDQTHSDTSRIVGTYGYMAPEYALNGFFSIKSDVYSFGVLVLEIVCGQRNNGFRTGENIDDLITYVWRNWEKGAILSIVDPIALAGSRIEIMRCIHIALLCVQDFAADRPTMSSVTLMLSSHSLSLPMPSEPTYISYVSDRSLVEDNILRSSTISTSVDQSRSKSTNWTSNEVSLTEEFGPR